MEKEIKDLIDANDEDSVPEPISATLSTRNNSSIVTNKTDDMNLKSTSTIFTESFGGNAKEDVEEWLQKLKLTAKDDIKLQNTLHTHATSMLTDKAEQWYKQLAQKPSDFDEFTKLIKNRFEKYEVNQIIDNDTIKQNANNHNESSKCTSYTPFGPHPLVPTPRFVLDTSGLAYIFMPVLKKVGNPINVMLSSSKFICKVEPDWNYFMTTNRLLPYLAECGVGIYDCITIIRYRNCYFETETRKRFEINKPVWTISTNQKSFDIDTYERTYFFIYFYMMTTGKIVLSADYVIPKFITEYIGLKSSKNEIIEMLGEVNVKSFDKNWIKTTNIRDLPKPIRSRLKKFFAGARLINLLKEYKPNKQSESNEKYHKIYEIIVNHFQFIYWEVHPFFRPNRMRSVCLTKNLQNLMTKIYTVKQLEDFVEKKLHYKVPIDIKIDNDYEYWNEETFAGYKTIINFE